MRAFRRAALIFLMMVIVAISAVRFSPTHFFAESRNYGSLDQLMPSSFGEWSVDDSLDARVVDPRVGAQLAAVYTSTLSRTYVNHRGERVMVALAYGRDQRGEGRAHYPEVCYPAQGFQIDGLADSALMVGVTAIPVTRLIAKQEGRTEPVTYWLTVGDQRVRPGIDQKAAVISYGLRGIVPDGTLVRISSIGSDSDANFALHEHFVQAWMAATPPTIRTYLFGRLDS